MLLLQYDMHFMPQKARKGQVIADILTENPRLDIGTLFEDQPNETAEAHFAQVNVYQSVWQMYFDGALRTNPHGGLIAVVGIVLISPQNHVIPRAFSRTEPCTNNVAEYNALLIGLQTTYQLGVRSL